MTTNSNLKHIHCIVTRFSFRFREDHPYDKLLDPKRLDERVRIFRQYCFPSVANQECKDFYWILIVDPLLPEEYREQLYAIFNDFYESPLYEKRGPRKIWLHTWDWSIHNLANIDWIMEHFSEQQPKYLITTRLDDDDSLAVNFTKMIRSNLEKSKINSFKYISYTVGYYYYSQKNTLRIQRVPLIAIGLTLITDISKYPMCVYLGNHTKIPSYLKTPNRHAKMNALYLENNDLPVTQRQYLSRIELIRGGNPMWIRNVHDYNLQKNIARHYNKRQNLDKIKEVLWRKFRIK